MKLIVMRHGECEGLDIGIINGWRDFPLNEHGKIQSYDAANKLKTMCDISEIEQVYTSYLSRAYDTAKYVLEAMHQDIKIIQDIRLNERHYGAFQGMVREEAYKYPEYNTLSLSADRLDNKLISMSDEEYEKQLEEYYQKLNISKEDLRIVLPKSESILDVQKRIQEFLSDKILIRDNLNKTILIVGHANTVKLIVGNIQGLDFNQITKLRFAPCGMTVFDIDFIDKQYIVKDIVNINDEYVK